MKRAIVALGALAVTLVAAAIALAGGGSSGPGDGPVESTAGTYGQRIAVGASTAMSHITLDNLGDEPAFIERVRLLGVTGPFEFLGVLGRRLPEDGTQYFGGAPGFPSSEYPARPLTADNPVPVTNEDRTRSMQIIIGVRVPEEGAARSNAIEITYRVGDERYREIFKSGIIICAPVDKYRECPHADEEFYSDKVVEWSAEDGVISERAQAPS